MKTAIEAVTCHWCHSVIPHANGNNLVYVGGVGDVYACDTYLKGGDCRRPTKRFARRPGVCRGCGFIIHKESYIIDWDGKAYHLKCKVEANYAET